MDYIIFNKYLEWERQKNQAEWKVLFRIPRKAYMYLIAMIFFGLIPIIIFCLNLNNQTVTLFSYIMSAIGIVLAVLFSRYVDNFEIFMSTEKLQNLDSKYNCLQNWLKSVGIKNKNQIKQLRNEIKQRVEQTERKQNKSISDINRWFQILIIPIMLAIVVHVLDQSSDTFDSQIYFLFFIVALIILFYLIVYGAFKLFSFISNRKQNELKYFVSDLQGLLDRKFEIEDKDLL